MIPISGYELPVQTDYLQELHRLSPPTLSPRNFLCNIDLVGLLPYFLQSDILRAICTFCRRDWRPCIIIPESCDTFWKGIGGYTWLVLLPGILVALRSGVYSFTR